MNYLPQLKKEEFRIRLVINTFTGNPQEYHQTEQLLYLIKVKNIKVSDTIDVNQEQVLERDKKLKQNPREYYHRQGKMFRINSKLILPQIIIEERLVLTYQQFLTLNESGYLDKLLNRTVCEHIRFFKNDIVYVRAKYSENVCIYCYSNKKIKKQISVICNMRDYFDEENNEFLTYCEKNEMRFEVFDYDNQFELLNDNIKSILKAGKSKSIIIGCNYSEPISFEEFYEHKINLRCKSCGKKISFGLSECGICLSATSNTTAASSEKKMPEKKNPYNFIDKLQLSKIDYQLKEVPKVLNYSFGSNEFEI